MKIWVVWEANTLVPKPFLKEKDAYEYRTLRQTRDHIRHQIYIAPAELETDE